MSDSQANPIPAKPLLIAIGMWLSSVGGVAFGLVLLAALLGFGEFTVDGRSSSGSDFLREVGIQFFSISILLLTIAYGVIRCSSWSRYVMVFFWLLLGAFQVGKFIGETARHQESREMSLLWVPALLVAVWYLFWKRNVVVYFQALESAENHSRSTTVTGTNARNFGIALLVILISFQGAVGSAFRTILPTWARAWPIPQALYVGLFSAVVLSMAYYFRDHPNEIVAGDGSDELSQKPQSSSSDQPPPA